MPGEFYVEDRKEKVDISQLVADLAEVKEMLDMSEVIAGINEIKEMLDMPEVLAGLAALGDKLESLVSPIDFWSVAEDVIDLSEEATDIDLPNVVVSGLPEGITLVRVVAMLKIRAIENTTGAGINAIDGVQAIKVKKSIGTWGLNDVAAIYLPDNLWTLEAAAREAGDLVIGDMDVRSAVDGQGIYNFRLEDARVNFDYLRLNDVLIGLRFYFIAGEA